MDENGHLNRANFSLQKRDPLFKHFAQLSRLSSSGQEKGRFGVGLGMFCVCTFPQKPEGFMMAE